MLWKIFFLGLDFLCNFIPHRNTRKHIRIHVLYDWRKKFKALRAAYPELHFRHFRIIKGGWNIGFIIDNKYVFKIRKFYDNTIPAQRIEREQRITNAFANIVNLRIPHIEIVKTGGYTFYKYDFIPGKNLTTFSQNVINNNAKKWAHTLAQFIFLMHNARPSGIDDLRDMDGDGWNHNDICNNILVDKKTMEIVGLIDWEYSGWGTLETEIANCTRFSKKMRASGINDMIQSEYEALCKNK